MLGQSNQTQIPKKNRKRRSQKGQAISEYGAVLAFVAVLVALTFSFSGGALGPAISSAFSSISQNLSDLSDAASAAS